MVLSMVLDVGAIICANCRHVATHVSIVDDSCVSWSYVIRGEATACIRSSFTKVHAVAVCNCTCSNVFQAIIGNPRGYVCEHFSPMDGTTQIVPHYV